MRNILATVFLLTTLLCAAPARAATVTTTADNGPGSLRMTIANAAVGETIDFAVSGSITLTSGELLIDKALIIVGPGAASLTIQRSSAVGTPDFRIFNVGSGIVTISGLAVNNGRAVVGGGLNNQTTLTLRDCVISGNVAGDAGGGIQNLSTLMMSNCAIRANVVFGGTNGGFGGGLNNAGTVIALSSSISSNVVAGAAGSGGFGGGLNNDGTLTITNSVINGNLSADNSNGEGGGIFNQGTLILDTSTIGSNRAQGNSDGIGGEARGGGVGNRLGTVTLVRSTISGNVAFGGNSTGGSAGAAQGGGIVNNLGTVIVENSTISGNASITGGGPAPFLQTGGGGLFNSLGSIALNHSTITSNIVAGGVSQPGGGLMNVGGVVEMKNSILAADSATYDLATVLSGDIQSGGFNLIGTTNAPIPTGPGDRFNVGALELRLGPLQDNGGPTFTHALLCGSLAINAGDNTNAPPTDQRGFPRIVDGTIDIGAYESSNSAPTITCPAPITLSCGSSTGQVATITVTVADPEGDALVVLWIVDGVRYQTNVVPAAGPPTTAPVSFTAAYGSGAHDVIVIVSDTSDCSASCMTSVTVGGGGGGDLYPIALHERMLAGVQVGDIIPDIYNGVQPGNFGWLTWAGRPNEPTLVTSLTPPGNSSTYVNPFNRNDRVVSVGDWVQGKPGISNSDKVRKALNTLKQIDIVVPVWDQAIGRGNNSLYRVVAFARVRITDYRLPRQNRITARFLGFVDCN